MKMRFREVKEIKEIKEKVEKKERAKISAEAKAKFDTLFEDEDDSENKIVMEAPANFTVEDAEKVFDALFNL